jgi:hypothetical protein
MLATCATHIQTMTRGANLITGLPPYAAFVDACAACLNAT